MNTKTARNKRQHSPTSKLANEFMERYRSPIKRKILETMLTMPVGGTFDEISKASGLERDQVWKRLPEMAAEESPLTVNTHYTRIGSRGLPQSVWTLVKNLSKCKKELRKVSQMD